jgi:hypothetical protein
MWVNFEVLPVTFGGKIANHGNLTEVTVTQALDSTKF